MKFLILREVSLHPAFMAIPGTIINSLNSPIRDTHIPPVYILLFSTIKLQLFISSLPSSH